MAPALHEVPVTKVFNEAGDYLIVDDTKEALEAIASKGYRKRKKPKRESPEVESTPLP